MKSKIINIAPEGNIFILIFAVITLVLFLISTELGLLGLALTIWCALFFRDPDRTTPQDESLVIAPADGRVIKIENVVPPEEIGIKEECLKIAIFMNVFNVHVNRVPCKGTVEEIIYHPGAFLNASLDKASEDNERQSFIMDTKNGKVAFVQIAGLVARRIVRFIEKDTEVLAGEKFGLIRFGSRVDIYLPKNAKVQVAEGQTTLAGETIIANFAKEAKELEYKVLDRAK